MTLFKLSEIKQLEIEKIKNVISELNYVIDEKGPYINVIFQKSRRYVFRSTNLVELPVQKGSIIIQPLVHLCDGSDETLDKVENLNKLFTNLKQIKVQIKKQCVKKIMLRLNNFNLIIWAQLNRKTPRITFFNDGIVYHDLSDSLNLHFENGYKPGYLEMWDKNRSIIRDLRVPSIVPCCLNINTTVESYGLCCKKILCRWQPPLSTISKELLTELSNEVSKNRRSSCFKSSLKTTDSVLDSESKHDIITFHNENKTIANRLLIFSGIVCLYSTFFGDSPTLSDTCFSTCKISFCDRDYYLINDK
jgi:hypothetical protein